MERYQLPIEAIDRDGSRSLAASSDALAVTKDELLEQFDLLPCAPASRLRL
jgi:hypothetical protein